MTEEISENISWSPTLEEYFVSTGEKCRGLAWCHTKAEAMYSRRRQIIDLPSIVLGSVVGFLQVGSQSMFKNPEVSSIWLGVASLFVSVLTTINSYYRWAARAEGHRVNSLHYGKLYRYISVQMGLPQCERIRAADFLNMVKEQYDRLQEVAPPIPTEVIKEFKTTFTGENYKNVARPEELNGLEKIKVFTSIKKSESFLSVGIDGSPKRERAEAHEQRIRVHQEESVLPSSRRRDPSQGAHAVLGEERSSIGGGKHASSNWPTEEGNPPGVFHTEGNRESS